MVMDALKQALHNQGQLRVGKDPYTAIKQAAQETGVDFEYLYRTAKRESGLNPSARAQTSSAAGLFQFTDDTWLRMVDRYGEKHGLESEAQSVSTTSGRVSVEGGVEQRKQVLALRDDPELSARMAGELARENAHILGNQIGRAPTSRELYAAHFLGPAGAAELINLVRKTPELDASSVFGVEARANPAIFNDSAGKPRSVAAVYARLTGQSLSDVEASGSDGAHFHAPTAMPVKSGDLRAWAVVEEEAASWQLKPGELLDDLEQSRSAMSALLGLQTLKLEE